MKQCIFNFDDGTGLFFVSDTHFGHESILHYAKRPFSSVEEMDQAMIDNWNKVVGPNDYVFHLGDFCFKGSQYWDRILNQLNGHKFLVLGNHDLKHVKDGAMYKFDWVGMQAYITVGGRSAYLNHNPFLCYGGTYRREEDLVYALNGHCHLTTRTFDGKDIDRLQYCFPTQFDVGVDANNFTPISWAEVDNRIKEQIAQHQNQYSAFKEYVEYAENKKEV